MRHHDSIKHSANIVYSILLIGFVYTLHLVIPIYVDSSFLGVFATERTIGILYTVGSVFTMILIFFMGRVLEKFGNYRTSLALVIINMFLFLGFMFGNSLLIVGGAFILSTAVVDLIGINLDVYLETYSDIRHTGGIRGLYMGINNVAWILAPLLGSALISGTTSMSTNTSTISTAVVTAANYRNVYIGAFSLLFVLLYLMYKHLRNFKDPRYNHLSLHQTLRRILKNEDLSKLFAANVILNTFYAWMVIYIPIYLHTNMGFGWGDIGVILTIMLLPFVIFQFPVGKLADRGWGEKKIMSIGFLIMGVSTCVLALLSGGNLLVWALALFVTRMGAAVAEVMIEAYFFKKVSPENADLLSSFRITRYAGYIIAPIITAIGLAYTTSANIFIILGLIVLWALRYSMTITDIV